MYVRRMFESLHFRLLYPNVTHISITTTLVYVFALTAVIISSIRLPPLPAASELTSGINLTEAWSDLQVISKHYHPYNSRSIDDTHDWLIQRVQSILTENNASAPSAYLFDDNVSNLTYFIVKAYQPLPVSTYFEARNIIIYVRGASDDQNEWWKNETAKPSDQSGVLINAHYDSGSTSYGATDDGAGVISILQLIRYFTTKGNQPKHGVVLLLNCGEENGLNGARVFSQHPLSRMVSRFVNLEGAGAGGRAAVFRATDTVVTDAYARVPYPFGTVASAEAFKRNLIKSGTDLTVWNTFLKYQGLDIAFVGPRARYHTDEDDIKHTSIRAVWHMLSAALASSKNLSDNPPGKKAGNAVIWFDILGSLFLVVRAGTWFLLSAIMLIGGPLVLLLILMLSHRLHGSNRFSDSQCQISKLGFKGVEMLNSDMKRLLGYPLMLSVSCAASMFVVFLIFRFNPYIVHSNVWVVWSSTVSSFIVVAWSFTYSMKGSSAPARAYGLTWLSAGWWVLLLVATVLLKVNDFYALYFALIYFTTVLIATCVTYLEVTSESPAWRPPHSDERQNLLASRAISAYIRFTSALSKADHFEASEKTVSETSLLLHTETSAMNDDLQVTNSDLIKKSSMPRRQSFESVSGWTWVLELVILVPPNVVVVGQLATYLVESLHQTGTDGSSLLPNYLGMAVLTICLFSPLTIFLPSFPKRVPSALLLVMVGSLAYSMLAFPWTSNNRFKLSFQQRVDLDEGTSKTVLVGVPGYLRQVISVLPSTTNHDVSCVLDPENPTRRMTCSWDSVVPNVGETSLHPLVDNIYSRLTHYNVTLVKNGTRTNTARFVVSGENTRACKLVFDSPIRDFHVSGQGPADERFPPVPVNGTQEIRLWSRSRDRTWNVDVTWPVEGQEKKDLTGRVVCLWADANQPGTIPAFDELIEKLPPWATFMSLGDGLVEAFKRFELG